MAAKNMICFRLAADEVTAIDLFLSKCRKRTGANYTASELMRRCLTIGLRDHKAELEKEAA